MRWETNIARRIFPKDQTFMARRKLRYALGALLAAALAAGMVVGIAILANRQQG